jgi:hypothetical protein
MPFLRDRYEIAKMAQLHVPYPIDMEIAVSILWIDAFVAANLRLRQRMASPDASHGQRRT